MKVVSACTKECHLEWLFRKTKILIIDLIALSKALIHGYRISLTSQKLDPDAAAFCLKLRAKAVVQSRNWVALFCPTVSHQIYFIMINDNENFFLIERTCVGLFRIAVRRPRKEELAWWTILKIFSRRTKKFLFKWGFSYYWEIMFVDC